MRNLFYFYLAIFLPVLFLFLLKKAELIKATPFVIALFAYAFIYRTLLEGIRLHQKGIIKKKDR